MKPSRTTAGIIGVVCGAELLVALLIGGAGIGSLFGWEGALVAGAVATLGGSYFAARRRRVRNEHAAAQIDEVAAM